ncbi:MAG: TIGR01244 family phosphatase [Rhizobiaceae bacterium]|nr:TIGR01244 family phosphatase [Rhizobiaceae bacterium]MCV0407880.1 TIGR01244 family phosphatase [Rhizobiaceae bacterium]
MEMRRITDDYAVSGQIEPADVAEIARAGYRTIVCHRPDGEVPDQPSHAEIEAAARAAGLDFRYIPVVSGQMTADNVADMAAVLDAVEGPVFGYCRSGARSTNIFMAARQGR